MIDYGYLALTLLYWSFRGYQETIKDADLACNHFQKKTRDNRDNERYLLVCPKGLPNIGNTCFTNVIIQSLYWTPNFKRMLENICGGKDVGYFWQLLGTNSNQSVCQLTSTMLDVMNQLQDNRTTYEEQRLKLKSLLQMLAKINKQFKGFHQQDSYEMFNTMINGIDNEIVQLSVSRRDQAHKDIVSVRQLFEGWFITTYHYSGCSHVDVYFQRFTSINIQIVEMLPECTTEQCGDKPNMEYSHMATDNQSISQSCIARTAELYPYAYGTLKEQDMSAFSSYTMVQNNLQVVNDSPKEKHKTNPASPNSDGIDLEERSIWNKNRANRNPAESNMNKETIEESELYKKEQTENNVEEGENTNKQGTSFLTFPDIEMRIETNCKEEKNGTNEQEPRNQSPSVLNKEDDDDDDDDYEFYPANSEWQLNDMSENKIISKDSMTEQKSTHLDDPIDGTTHADDTNDGITSSGTLKHETSHPFTTNDGTDETINQNNIEVGTTDPGAVNDDKTNSGIINYGISHPGTKNDGAIYQGNTNDRTTNPDTTHNKINHLFTSHDKTTLPLNINEETRPDTSNDRTINPGIANDKSNNPSDINNVTTPQSTAKDNFKNEASYKRTALATDAEIHFMCSSGNITEEVTIIDTSETYSVLPNFNNKVGAESAINDENGLKCNRGNHGARINGDLALEEQPTRFTGHLSDPQHTTLDNKFKQTPRNNVTTSENSNNGINYISSTAVQDNSSYTNFGDSIPANSHDIERDLNNIKQDVYMNSDNITHSPQNPVQMDDVYQWSSNYTHTSGNTCNDNILADHTSEADKTSENENENRENTRPTHRKGQFMPNEVMKETHTNVEEGLQSLFKTDDSITYAFVCKQCPDIETACTKRMEIIVPPPILILHISKVKQQTDGCLQKLSTGITYPEYIDLNTLDIFSKETFNILRNNGPITAYNTSYRLYSVVCHRGTMNSGHYFAYIRKTKDDEKLLELANKNVFSMENMDDVRLEIQKGIKKEKFSVVNIEEHKRDDGNWFKFSDSVVCQANPNEALRSECACMLFYEMEH